MVVVPFRGVQESLMLYLLTESALCNPLCTSLQIHKRVRMSLVLSHGQSLLASPYLQTVQLSFNMFLPKCIAIIATVPCVCLEDICSQSVHVQQLLVTACYSKLGEPGGRHH